MPEERKDAASILTKVNDYTWDIPVSYKPGMRVPGRIFVSQKLLQSIEHDTLEQTVNLATLPGIQKYAMAMPDAHSGYGFPIGGVAAFDRNFGSACQGAGRVSSRGQALREFRGEAIQKELAAKGISVRATHPSVITEEAPLVYKPSEDGVDVVHQLGIARKVVKVMPIGVAKG